MDVAVRVGDGVKVAVEVGDGVIDAIPVGVNVGVRTGRVHVGVYVGAGKRVGVWMGVGVDGGR